MSSDSAPLTSSAVHCGRCGYDFDPGKMPGGLCPRCLLLGMGGGFAASLKAANLGGTEPESPEDELAKELPGFILEEQIGRGGGGLVWKAKESVLNRPVAVKLLRNSRSDPDFIERFEREARVLAQLTHPNIVTLFTFGRTRSSHFYLVMEFVDGTDLGKQLAHGPLDVPAALSIACEVCAALRHAHDAGFIHRDIKPGNILLNRSGRVKVADFGAARLGADAETVNITHMGTAVGTPHYIAPEQARGTGLEDQRADIYACGVMLYEMLTGELPRGVFMPPSSKRKMDRRLDAIVLRALQEDPDMRYPGISDFAADLQKVRQKIDPQIIAERRVADRSRRWQRRLEMALAIAVSLVLGIIIAGRVQDWFQGSRPAKRSFVSPGHLDGGVTVNAAAPVSEGTAFAFARRIQLRPPALAGGSHFGGCVALSHDWLAVGAPDDLTPGTPGHGAVYLYQRGEGGWTLKQRIPNPLPDAGSRSGHNVTFADGKLVIGSSVAKQKTGTGSEVFLGYRLSADESQWQRLPGEAIPPRRSGTGDDPARRIVLTGDLLVIGDPHAGSDRADDATATGAVSIFELAKPQN